MCSILVHMCSILVLGDGTFCCHMTRFNFVSKLCERVLISLSFLVFDSYSKLVPHNLEVILKFSIHDWSYSKLMTAFMIVVIFSFSCTPCSTWAYSFASNNSIIWSANSHCRWVLLDDIYFSFILHHSQVFFACLGKIFGGLVCFEVLLGGIYPLSKTC